MTSVERRQIDVFSDKLSLIYPISHTNSAWESELNSRHPQCGQYVLKSEQACGSTGQLNVSRNEMRCMRAMPYHDTSKLVTFKGPATRVLDAGSFLYTKEHVLCFYSVIP